GKIYRICHFRSGRDADAFCRDTIVFHHFFEPNETAVERRCSKKFRRRTFFIDGGNGHVFRTDGDLMDGDDGGEYSVYRRRRRSGWNGREICQMVRKTTVPWRLGGGKIRWSQV